MSWRAMVGLAGFLVACGDGDGAVDTREECKAAGGRVVAGTGFNTVACDADEENLGSLPGAYEGALCCRAK